MTKPPEPVVTGELKPCPFCGTTNLRIIEVAPVVSNYRRVSHDPGKAGFGCFVSGPIRVGEAEAVAAWNTRTANALPGDVGMLEALEAAYMQGAMDVHAHWLVNPGDAPRGDPEFGEAASDYAAAALDPFDSSARAALTSSALSGEQCRRCGHGNPSWSAPSPLWNAVIRGGSIDGEPTFDDMVCASCFTELAEQQGIASGWTVKADKINVPLETTTPSGRVWDDDKGLWVSALSGDAGEGRVSEALGFGTGNCASLNLQGALDDLQGRYQVADGGVIARTIKRVIGQIEAVRAALPSHQGSR